MDVGKWRLPFRRPILEKDENNEEELFLNESLYEKKRTSSILLHSLSIVPLGIVVLVNMLIMYSEYEIGNIFLSLVYVFTFCIFVLYYFHIHFFYLLFIYIGFLIFICLHEFFHAYIAFKCGDITMLYKGYLHFDISNYFDISHTILIPLTSLFITGFSLPGSLFWIDPLLIDKKYYLSLIYISGPFSDFLCIICIAVFYNIFRLVKNKKENKTIPRRLLLLSLATLDSFLVESFLLNLLPIIGFDGWGVIEPFLPLPLTIILKEGPISIWLTYLCPVSVFLYFYFFEEKYHYFSNVSHFILLKILHIQMIDVFEGVNKFPTLHSLFKNI